MIDLYYWTTPNGHKITMFLEEAGLEYGIMPVNIGKRRAVPAGVPQDLAEQPHPGDRRSRAGRRRRADQRLRVGRDPALPGREDRALHPDGLRGARRGAAVAVLADGRPRARWPGRTTTSATTRPRSSPTRSTATSTRRTASTACSTSGWPTAPFIAGDYSIADMASYPWIVPYERQGQKLDDFPNLKRWFEAIARAPGDGAGLRGRRAATGGATPRRRGDAQGPLRADRGQPAAGLSGACLAGARRTVYTRSTN